MDKEQLLDELSFVFDNGETTEYSKVEQFLDALEQGLIRCANKIAGEWQVDGRVKKAILLAFRMGELQSESVGPLTFIDRKNLWPRKFELKDKVRIIPGGASIRRGAFLGANTIILPPSFVNIGAFIDEGSLVDSNALVGSCAQVGKKVHISAGVQIGGVLEPVGARPVIIEDNALLGGQSGIFEGCTVGAGAVIGAGVILTKSTKVYDLVHGTVLMGDEFSGVKIPENAVVVPGARALAGEFAKSQQLSISAPLIIKYRDEKTDQKTALEEALRP